MRVSERKKGYTVALGKKRFTLLCLKENNEVSLATLSHESYESVTNESVAAGGCNEVAKAGNAAAAAAAAAKVTTNRTPTHMHQLTAIIGSYTSVVAFKEAVQDA